MHTESSEFAPVSFAADDRFAAFGSGWLKPSLVPAISRPVPVSSFRAQMNQRAAAHSQNALIREILVAVALDPKQGSDKLALLRPSELTSVLQAGMAQGLGSALVASLHAERIPVPRWLEDHRFNVAMQRDRIMSTLAAIAPALTAAELSWVVLKGPAIAARYEWPKQREFADLDILVPGRCVRTALNALQEVGVDTLNRNWAEYLRYGVAEFPVFMAGTAIDLHWHVIGLEAKRKRFGIRVEEMLDRRKLVELEGIACWQLDPEDSAIHVALHAGLSGACRMGWLRDVDRTVRTDDVDWQVLASRALRYRVAPIVGHVLDRCRQVMGTPVPREVPELLTPRTALHARRWLDRDSLLLSKPAEYAYHGFAVEVSRAGMIPTLGRTRELLRDRLMEIASRAPGWSAYDPHGPLYWNRSTGGPDGLDRYLEYALRHP